MFSQSSSVLLDDIDVELTSQAENDYYDELYEPCKENGKPSAHYKIAWVDNTIQTCPANKVFQKLFKDLGFSQFLMFYTINDFEKFLLDDYTNNNLIVIS